MGGSCRKRLHPRIFISATRARHYGTRVQYHLAIVLVIGCVGFALGYALRAHMSHQRRRMAREQRNLGLDG
jgi:hypothetical protein